MSKDKAKVDLWMKEIAPSHALRKWFGHDPDRWPEFMKRYGRELQSLNALKKQIKQLEKKHLTLTLLYSARDEQHNQAVALRGILSGMD
jgi:uncharacterized protein YeaO (DUF488 family)